MSDAQTFVEITPRFRPRGLLRLGCLLRSRKLLRAVRVELLSAGEVVSVTPLHELVDIDAVFAGAQTVQQIAGTPEEEQVRQIVREEIASMAGLVLRRTSEEHLTRSPDRNITDTQIRGMLAEIFGEVLSDFSRTESSPGT